MINLQKIFFTLFLAITFVLSSSFVRSPHLFQAKAAQIQPNSVAYDIDWRTDKLRKEATKGRIEDDIAPVIEQAQENNRRRPKSEAEEQEVMEKSKPLFQSQDKDLSTKSRKNEEILQPRSK
ncbi:MAG: hypothetical protein ACOC04_01715 [Halothece sp.]